MVRKVGDAQLENLKIPKNYEPNYTNKKYTEGTIHINVDCTKEYKPMKDFTIQDQVEHVLGVALAQVYSLKKGPEEFGQDEKMLCSLNYNNIMTWIHIFQWTQAN